MGRLMDFGTMESETPASTIPKFSGFSLKLEVFYCLVLSTKAEAQKQSG